MFNVLNYTGAAAFNPLDYSPQAYFGFNQGITYNPTTYAVSQWDDLTGNGYNAQQLTTAQQPIYDNTTGLIAGGLYKSLDTGFSWTDPSSLIIRMKVASANVYYAGHNIGNFKRVRTLNNNSGRTEYSGSFFNPFTQPTNNTLYNISILQNSPNIE